MEESDEEIDPEILKFFKFKEIRKNYHNHL